MQAPDVADDEGGGSEQPADEPLSAVIKYLGVQDLGTGEYRTCIKLRGQQYNLGFFQDAVSAAKAFDWAARLIGGGRQLNFDREVDLGTPPSTVAAASLRARVAQVGGTAAAPERAAGETFIGTFKGSKASGHEHEFQAAVRLRGKHYFLGYYPDARSAAKAYDWAARLIRQGKPLNFEPDEDLGAPPTTPAAARLRHALAAAPAQAAASAQVEELLCAICTDTMAERTYAQLDCCTHRFHFSCMQKWVKRANQCPMCRATVSTIEKVVNGKRKAVLECADRSLAVRRAAALMRYPLTAWCVAGGIQMLARKSDARTQ